MNRVFFHRVPLPMTIKGVTIPDPDGDYTVIINDQLCPETQEEIASHELAHIRHHDHSPAFYAEVERYLPDWRARRELLKN